MAATKAAGALITMMLVLPATAAADPVGEGGFTPGANPNQIILDLRLLSDGTVQFGRFDLPSAVTGSSAGTAPQGTSCGADATNHRRLRCGFGPNGWQRGERVTLTVDTDQPVSG